jgi:ABC-2 type transport system permease protein
MTDLQPSTFQLSNHLRSFRLAAWLGWQIESNWTQPFLFAIYSVIKPLSGAALLVVMYAMITQNSFNNPLFPYIYLGNAFYIYVGQIMNGLAWAVVDDREHYKTLKYIYTAPVHYPTYLMGRSVARFLIASLSVLITILFGALFLHVRIDLAAVDWPLFLVTLLLGVFMLAMMGLILAGFMLLLVRHSWEIGGAVAGALYLFSGAVFPLDVLPAFLRPVGFIVPVTYWLELLRRSLVGSVAQAFPTLASFSNLQLLDILLGLTVIFTILAIVSFRRNDHLARERGLIDMVTNY